MNKKQAPGNLKTQPQKQVPAPKIPKVWKAEDYTTNNIPLDEVIAVKEAFDIFDSDHTGVIDPVQLRNAFISLGFANHNKFVLRVLQDYENEGVQGLDFGEFLKLSTSRLSDTGSRAEVERIFKHFDINKTGKISHTEMKKVAEQLNENLTDEQIQKMIIKADSDEDGMLTADDFYNVLTSMNGGQYE